MIDHNKDREQSVLPPHVRPIRRAKDILPPHILPISPRDNLSRELYDSLNRFGPKTPEVFKKQAEEVARFIGLLDQGARIDDPDTRKFVTDLLNTNFVLQPAMKSPRKLPSWLQIDFLVANGFRNPIAREDVGDKCGELFDKWVAEMEYKYTKFAYFFESR